MEGNRFSAPRGKRYFRDRVKVARDHPAAQFVVAAVFAITFTVVILGTLAHLASVTSVGQLQEIAAAGVYCVGELALGVPHFLIACGLIVRAIAVGALIFAVKLESVGHALNDLLFGKLS